MLLDSWCYKCWCYSCDNPLIALMHDQVEKLKNKFFYVTPEFALSAQAVSCFQLMIENQSLERFVLMRHIV